MKTLFNQIGKGQWYLILSFLFFSFYVNGQYGTNNGAHSISHLVTNATNNDVSLELIDFTFIQNGGNNVLYWLTAQEKNISHFIIEASDSGKEFHSVATINANKRLQKLTEYSEKLEIDAKATRYYRLKIIDNHQNINYSDVIGINVLSKKDYPLFLIADQQLNVFQTDKLREPLHMKLSYVDGPLVRTFELKDNYELPLQELEKGAYIVHFQNKDMKGVWRFVKN